MADNIVNARIQLKNDTKEHWAAATGFIPRIGEIIIYNADNDYPYPRFKVGDGITAVPSLPFSSNVAQILLDNKIMIKTTAQWAATPNYIPEAGTIMIYSDRNTLTKNNVTYNVAGIKIADGLAYGIDQPFVGDDIAAQIMSELTIHINDTEKHITNSERSFWNNKINCLDNIQSETLILTRL